MTANSSEPTGVARRTLWRLRGSMKAQATVGRNKGLVLSGTAVVLAILVGATIWIIGQEERSDAAVAHTFQNEGQLARVLSLLQDAELGQRGYLLTGDGYYLDPYNSASANVEGALQSLAEGMSDNTRQDGNLAVLRMLAAQKMSELRETVERRQRGDAAGALLTLQGGQGKHVMDAIRDVVSRMRAEEERLLGLRTAAARRSVLIIELTILVLVLLCGALLLTAFGTAIRRARSAEASRDELLGRFDRRLMAVLAADVTSYSSHMERDEAGTLAQLIALRDRVDPLIAKHGGWIASTAGDSLLAVFASALSAVDCAVEMQTPSTSCDIERSILFRVGINVGDVIEQRGDVFGDTVNIAARLESLAPPGGICVSRAVRDHVSKQRGFTFHDIGPQTVKNIAEPVSAFTIQT